MIQNFGHAAVVEFMPGKEVAGRAVEMKICEAGFCGGLRFTRAVPSCAKHGEKYCDACRAKIPPPPRARVRTFHLTPEAAYRGGMARYIQ